MTRRRITISANVPDDADDDELAAYIADALGSWGGQFNPDTNPLFDCVDVLAVTIRNNIYKKGA